MVREVEHANVQEGGLSLSSSSAKRQRRGLRPETKMRGSGFSMHTCSSCLEQHRESVLVSSKPVTTAFARDAHLIDCSSVSYASMVHISPAVRRYIIWAEWVAGAALNVLLLLVDGFHGAFEPLHAKASGV